MTNKTSWILASILVLGGGVIAFEMFRGSKQPTPQARVTQDDEPLSVDRSQTEVTPNPPESTVSELAAAVREDAGQSVAAPPTSDATRAENAPRSHKSAAKSFAIAQVDAEPTQPIARIALSFVGIDPDAEDVWMAAINDMTLPVEERKNLIEDLNEDGFADPDHPSRDELPLIVSRLELIESLAPDAVDDVNLAAFEEAHKDLVNMYRQLVN